jgi:hypothetical protein
MHNAMRLHSTVVLKLYLMNYTNVAAPILDSTQLPDMITAVTFLPDGKTCIAGTLGGLCMFYDVDGLKYVNPQVLPWQLQCAHHCGVQSPLRIFKKGHELRQVLDTLLRKPR